jgi:hypothetical protein
MMTTTRRRAGPAALALSAALIASIGIGSASAGSDTGYRDIQDFATAGFQAWVSECLWADPNVVYAAGDNLQNPIGSGQPTRWADAVIRINLFDGCNNDTAVWHLEGIGFPDDGPDFDRLESASLDVSHVTLDDGAGTLVDAEIHLAWLGQGPVEVRIGHHGDRGYYRQERSRSATVTGTVALGPSPFWTGLTLTGDQSHDVFIGTANEIALP